MAARGPCWPVPGRGSCSSTSWPGHLSLRSTPQSHPQRTPLDCCTTSLSCSPPPGQLPPHPCWRIGWKRKKKDTFCFAVFANFHGVNTPMGASPSYKPQSNLLTKLLNIRPSALRIPSAQGQLVEWELNHCVCSISASGGRDPRLLHPSLRWHPLCRLLPAPW